MNMSADTWQVEVEGSASDLEHLARHFTSKPFKVLKNERDGGFLYESESFAACHKSGDVLRFANEELRVLSGVLKITRDSLESLRSGAVYKCNAFGGRDVFVHLNDMALAHDEVGEVIVMTTGGSIITRPAPPPRSVAVAQLTVADLSVAKAMRLLAARDCKSWVGMYRIHEVIEADVGGEHALKKHGWGSARDLKRFKHSANSVAVAGDSARHGVELGQPMTHPMSREEAAAYLKFVLWSWLSSKDV